MKDEMKITMSACIVLRISAITRRNLQAEAKKQQRSEAQIVRQAINRYLAYLATLQRKERKCHE